MTTFTEYMTWTTSGKGLIDDKMLYVSEVIFRIRHDVHIFLTFSILIKAMQTVESSNQVKNLFLKTIKY